MGSAREVRVVRSGDLDANTGQTAGLKRLEAISAKRTGAAELWMGYAVLEPGARTGVHHHGDSETAVYVLRGRGRWWVGADLDTATEAGAGDFIFIPPGVVHLEENPSDTEPVEMVVARSTQEAIVVNLPDHEKNAAARPHPPASRAATTD